jgi:hypothetical protein
MVTAAPVLPVGYVVKREADCLWADNPDGIPLGRSSNEGCGQLGKMRICSPSLRIKGDG